MPSFPRCAWEC